MVEKNEPRYFQEIYKEMSNSVHSADRYFSKEIYYPAHKDYNSYHEIQIYGKKQQSIW